MRITISIFNPQAAEQDTLLTLDIFPDMTLSTLRETIQADANIPPTSQNIYHNGRLVSDDGSTMEQLQIADGDMLAVHVRDLQASRAPPARGQPSQQLAQRGGAPQSAGNDRAENDPELLRLRILGSPALRQQLQSQHPQLASAVNDPVAFGNILRESQERSQRERLQRQREMELLNDDPFNEENQRKIEEMIRQERVTENLQSAMEHNPEVFGRVHLLYIHVEVNGHRLKALVDSGAQVTIMSPACAEACNIMRLIDTRFAGVARGVGEAKILGRVHAAQIKIGTSYLACSFTVMEGKNVELLLGLDMLKSFQARIDLGRDRLIIRDEEIAFLGEADIPKESELADPEPTAPGPDGTTIGQRSGAVMPAGADAPQAQSSSAPGASSAAAAPSQPASSGPNVSPQNVESLVSMGASREDAVQALQAADDNVEVAAGLIFF